MVCPCESKEVHLCRLVNQLIKCLGIHQMLRGKLPPLWYVMCCKTCQICLRCIQKAPFPSFLEAPPSLIGFFLEPPCQKKTWSGIALKKILQSAFYHTKDTSILSLGDGYTQSYAVHHRGPWFVCDMNQTRCT